MAKSTNGGRTGSRTGNSSKPAADQTKARRAPRRRTPKPADETAIEAAVEQPTFGAARVDPVESASVGRETAMTMVETTGSVVPSEDEVRRRAYEIYIRHGRTNGRDLEDWLEAEKELKERTH